MIDTLPADVLAEAQVIFFYGSPFGSTQGPARVTPAAFVAQQAAAGKAIWGGYFPGSDPASALAEAEAAPRDTGVWVDLEPEVEADEQSLAWCAAFGDFMLANGMPCGIYSHEGTCADLAGHFSAQWWDGQPQPTSLPSATAIQYGQQTASNGVPFDRDACDAYFLDPPAPVATIQQDLVAYVSTHLGTEVDVPGWPGPNDPECTDWALSWFLHRGGNGGLVHGNAVAWAGQDWTASGWVWVANTPTNMPSIGDIVTWGPTPSLGIGAAGHTGIVYDNVTVMSLETADQNWGANRDVELETHSYVGVLGWHTPSKP
jgi:hypothetical protein